MGGRLTDRSPTSTSRRTVPSSLWDTGLRTRRGLCNFSGTGGLSSRNGRANNLCRSRWYAKVNSSSSSRPSVRAWPLPLGVVDAFGDGVDELEGFFGGLFSRRSVDSGREGQNLSHMKEQLAKGLMDCPVAEGGEPECGCECS